MIVADALSLLADSPYTPTTITRVVPTENTAAAMCPGCRPSLWLPSIRGCCLLEYTMTPFLASVSSEWAVAMRSLLIFLLPTSCRRAFTSVRIKKSVCLCTSVRRVAILTPCPCLNSPLIPPTFCVATLMLCFWLSQMVMLIVNAIWMVLIDRSCFVICVRL